MNYILDMAEIIPIHQHKENFNEAVKNLSNLCKEDLHSINTLILEKLDSSVPLIQEIGRYLILSGGKRLRPLLTTSCFHILNNQSLKSMNHIGLAAAVEFIHAATLLHDDVIDNSDLRRGIKTANSVWGNQSSILVGGQAVMEGVMMRVPGAYATAVRDPQGNIQIDRHEFKSIIEIYPFFKKPLLRGILGLFESLKIGYSTLQWSAEISFPEEENSKETSRFVDILLTLFSFGLALGLFFVAPIGLTSWLFDKDQDALLFNLISGLFRVLFFLTYLILISLMKDVRRLFQYHGAEHKVVYTFEHGDDLLVENANKYPTQHPRCGTSFMFIVLLSAIIVFSIIDAVVMGITGHISLPIRLMVHLPLIPLVAGVSYEIIKLTARNGDNIFFQMLRAPGLWLQNITTSHPEDDMVEVAITALKEAFGDEYEKMVGKEYVAEAIG